MIRIILTTLLTFIINISLQAQNNIDWASLKFSNDSLAQKYIYQIKTNDGSKLFGELVRLRNTTLTVRTIEFGEVNIDIKNLESIIDQEHSEALINNTTVGRNHYLISPSPYGLDKGEFNFQNSEIFLLSGWYGITDNFTLGGGFSAFPGTSFDDQVFYIIPKISLNLAPKVTTSIQYTQLFVQGITELSLLSFSTGFGNADKHFSIGYSTSLQFGSANAINLGGAYKVGRKFAFIADSYFFGDAEASMIGLGGRIIGASSSFDFGFLTVEEVSIPWLNYTVRF